MHRVEYPMVCRLCLLQSDCCINIFSPYGDDGFFVWKIIGELIDSEVSQEDGLPPTICTVCMRKLTDFQHFKSKCIESKVEFLKLQTSQGLIVHVKREEDALDGLEPADWSHPTGDEYSIHDPLGCVDDADSEVPVKREDVCDYPVDQSTSINCDKYPERDPLAIEDDANSEVPAKIEEISDESEDQTMPIDDDGYPEPDPLGSVNDENCKVPCLSRRLHTGGCRDLNADMGGTANLNVLDSETLGMTDGSASLPCGRGNQDADSSRTRVGCFPLSWEDRSKVEEGEAVSDGSAASPGVPTSPLPVELYRTANSGSPHTCRQCAGRFVDEKHLSAHVKRSHLDKVEFSSESCGEEEFGKEAPLSTHGENPHKSARLHECSQCGERLVSLYSLREHVLMNHSRKKRGYTCDSCLFTFSRKGHLKEHLASPKKSYPCDLCPSVFSLACRLRLHRTEHTERKMHSCSVCGKRYKYKSLLERHAVVHTKARPYSCGVCSKGFQYADGLKCHMVVHSEEKANVCEVCSKRFSFASSLRAHLRVHSGENLHSCPECGKKFPYRSAVKRHMWTHSDEKRYPCGLCTKRYSTASLLRNHVAVVHDGGKPPLLRRDVRQQ